jgi:hypothetical protein
MRERVDPSCLAHRRQRLSINCVIDKFLVSFPCCILGSSIHPAKVGQTHLSALAPLLLRAFHQLSLPYKEKLDTVLMGVTSLMLSLLLFVIEEKELRDWKLES